MSGYQVMIKMFASILVIISMIPGLACGKSPESIDNKKTEENKMPHISWESPYNRDDQNVIPGSIQTDSGRVNLRWLISASGFAKLVVLTVPGAGDRPPVESVVFVLNLPEGRTILLREWTSLTNILDPLELRQIATVNTADLFSVTGLSLNPVTIPPTTQTIVWDKSWVRNGTNYVGGSLSVEADSTMRIFWKNQNLPELGMLSFPAAGDRPPRETKLYFWKDIDQGTTIIARFVSPLANQPGTSFLLPVAKLNTADFMEGLKKLAE